MSTYQYHPNFWIDQPTDRAPFIDALKRAIKRIHRDNNDDKQTLSQLMTVYAHRVGYDQWSLFVEDIPKMTLQRFDRIQELFEQMEVLPRLTEKLYDYDDDEVWFDDYWFDSSGD